MRHWHQSNFNGDSPVDLAIETQAQLARDAVAISGGRQQIPYRDLDTMPVLVVNHFSSDGDDLSHGT